MGAIFKKSLAKWSLLAVMGVSAYFLGYFWGLKTLGPEESAEDKARLAASPSEPPPLKSNQTTDLGKLK